MLSVLVLGGSGLIGFEVATAFIDRGCKVYAVTRSIEKANLLIKNENLRDISNWIDLAYKVDVIVEAVSDRADPSTPEKIFHKIKEVKAKRLDALTVIYTSGVWTFDHVDMGDEASPINLNPVCASRIHMEQGYLAIGATVIKPGLVYGRSSSKSFTQLVRSVLSGVVVLPGTEHGWTPFIHVIDLAQLYVLAVQRREKAMGQVFIGVTNNYKRKDLVVALAKAANVVIKSMEFIKPVNTYQEFQALSQSFSNHKARHLLHWKPCQPSPFEDPDRYIQAFKSFHHL
eukprot:gene4271-4986_t